VRRPDLRSGVVSVVRHLLLEPLRIAAGVDASFPAALLLTDPNFRVALGTAMSAIGGVTVDPTAARRKRGPTTQTVADRRRAATELSTDSLSSTARDVARDAETWTRGGPVSGANGTTRGNA